MDSRTLGKRIREARLAKKMTQSEVVGTFITRNMLSQIESGVATPSMKTLEYLADVLELSVPALMGEEADAKSFHLLSCAKAALKAKNADEVIKLLGNPDKQDVFYDEYCALLAIAYSMQNGKEAKRNAKHYASQSIYSAMNIT